MKKMFRPVWVVSIFIILLVIGGCKKTKNQTDLSGNYYISFQENGNQIKYTVPFDIDSLPVNYNFLGYHYNIWSMGGANVQQQSLMELSIITKDTLPQAGKMYKESDNNIPSGVLSEVLFEYAPSWNVAYYQPISFYVVPGIDTYPDIPRDCIITITDVGSSTLKGTFSGTVYNSDDNADPILTDKISITDGTFYLPASF